MSPQPPTEQVSYPCTVHSTPLECEVENLYEFYEWAKDNLKDPLPLLNIGDSVRSIDLKKQITFYIITKGHHSECHS